MRHFLTLLILVGFAGCDGLDPEPAVEWDDGWAQAHARATYLILETQIQDAPTDQDGEDGPCSDCGGRGVVGDHNVPCTTCGGTPVSALFSVEDRLPRLLVFSANWCPPCNALKTQVIYRMGPKWKVGGTSKDDIQVVDCSQTDGELAAEEFYGIDIPALPHVVIWWAAEKHIVYDKEKHGPLEKPSHLSAFFNSQVAATRIAKVSKSLPQQLIAELHRVTKTQLPMSGIDLDVSDKTEGVPEILAALASGTYTPAEGVTVSAESGGNLYPTRTTSTDTHVRLHFDQRPTVKAKKWLLTLNTTLQWVDISKDGRRANVSLKRFPDISLSL